MSRRLFRAFPILLFSLFISAVIMAGCGNSDQRNYIAQPTGGTTGATTGTLLMEIQLGAPVNAAPVRAAFGLVDPKEVRAIYYQVFNFTTRSLEKSGRLTFDQFIFADGTATFPIPDLTAGPKIIIITVEPTTGSFFYEELVATVTPGQTTKTSNRSGGIPIETRSLSTTPNFDRYLPSDFLVAGPAPTNTTPTPNPVPSPTTTPNPNPVPSPTTTPTPAEPLPPGAFPDFLFVNNRSATNNQDVSVVKLSNTGAVGIPSISPEGAADTPGRAEQITVVDRFVVVANGSGGTGELPNSLSTFRIGDFSGSLTLVAQTLKNSIGTTETNILRLDSGGATGAKCVVSLASFDNLLKTWVVGADGKLTAGGSVTLEGSSYRDIKYYDRPNSDVDYLYVSGTATNGGARNLIRGYNVAARTGQLVEIPGSPWTHPNSPGPMTTVSNNLVVANIQTTPSNSAGSLSRYEINNLDGTLTLHNDNVATEAGPAALASVGNLVYVANSTSASITGYRMGDNGLEALPGGRSSVADAFPHSLAIIPPKTQTGLAHMYVLTSTKLAFFYVEMTTGNLTDGRGVAPNLLEGFQGPGDVRASLGQ